MRKSLLAYALLSTVTLSGCIDTGSGEKIGSIVKLAQEGVWCKTWEGEIIRGGLSNGSGVNGQSFRFTIEDNPELVEKIKGVMESQQEIKLHYRTEMTTFCRSNSPSHAFVTSVEVLGKEAARPLKIDSSEPIQVQAATGETRDDKIMKLLKTQQALIEELANVK